MSGFKSPEKIQNMFNCIANKYDFLNHIISFGTHKYIKSKSVENIELPQNARIIDLCTGTGDIAFFLKKFYPDANITAIDFSENMLEIARNKVKNVEFIQMDCTQLHFENETFDLATISFGLRNIEEPMRAISEIYRTLKKGGKFIHVDFGGSNRLFNLIYDSLIPLLIGFFQKDSTPYKYLIKSKQTFPKPNELIHDFESIGFKYIQKKNLALGMITAIVMKKP